MIKDIQELNFPSYATMSAATVTLPDMGEWTITSQIKIDGQIAPDFSFDWEILHDGHKYIMPLRKPQGSKDNESLPSVIDLTFQHWAQYQLKRWPFVTMQPIDSGTAVADEEVATVSLNLGDFRNLFAQVLAYYYGDKITIDLNPEWEYKSEAEVITISHTKVWNVLVDVFHKQFGVRWAIEPNGSPDKYVIKLGYPTTEQSHIFEYGFEGGLMKVERQVQSDEICNMIKGRGGEKNLPYRYFKKADSKNQSFKADPDWIEELANIYFSNLMPATFRSYVQGWKAAHLDAKDSKGNLLYADYTPVGEANAYAPWAYRKGYTDTKFHPVEFVADEITVNPEEGDRQIEILPGYSPFIKKGSSLDKYGPLQNSLDNNEEIYPTIQGVVVDPYGRIDEVVAVEEILSDDVEEATENDAQLTEIPPIKSPSLKVEAGEREKFILSGDIVIEEGRTGNFLTELTVSGVNSSGNAVDGAILELNATVLTDKVTGESYSASGAPAGSYTYDITAIVHNSANEPLYVTVQCQVPYLNDGSSDERWSNVWHIWVKNIWGTSKKDDETDAEYAERVWRPILGDRVGNEAKVVFASGALSISEDYEFTITALPKYERKLCKWQTVEKGQIVEHEYWSEWCMELGKNEADLESLGVYLPSTMRQAVAGDFFFFIGIDMPHQYVTWSEARLDDWKKDNLLDKKDIKPTWVVQTDRVRLNNEGRDEALIRKLRPGDTLCLADKRFIEGDYETLYLSSLTITYREPTKDDAALNPDVEIVLSDRYEVSANIVSTLQGEVSALAKQVGSISNIEHIVRAVGDKLYLRKDGIPDRSLSPTEFASLLTSLNFRSGMVGGAGWGIFKDANGNWTIEADRFMARQDLEVNNLVINQVKGQGGTVVDSAAQMEITRVENTGNGYKCYFDQKGGTVANLFHADDIAWNNRLTPDNMDLKAYRRRVTEVGPDYVVLSDTDVNGKGIPSEGDVIVQRGNYTDENRRFIKIRDVIGGGYERYIEGLDSVFAEGVEYHFVGRQNNQGPRWFTGNRDKEAGSGKNDGSYIEYKDNEFNLNNVALSVGSRIGDVKLSEIIQGIDDSKYLREALNQSTEVINGLVLTSAILLGYQNELGERVTTAGHNGLYQNSKTIASFWGGDMVDKFYDSDGIKRQTPILSGYASAIVRMDGTGYLAKGTITWDSDGSVTAADGNLYWDAFGNIHLGAGVFVGDTADNTLGSVLDFINGISSLLRPMNGDKVLKWKDVAANPNAATALRSMISFYSEGGITALGHGGDYGGTSSGGGSSYNRLDDWADYTSDKSGYVLSAGLGADLKSKLDGIAAGANKYVLPVASDTVLGGVIIGENISIDNGVISTHAPYTHPTATANTIVNLDGRVLSSIKVNALGHVTSVSSKMLTSDDIPTLSISKISNLQADLDSKLSLSGGSMDNDNLVGNLNADQLDGRHSYWFIDVNNSLLSSNIDFNTVLYRRHTGLTIQPMHVPNYENISNAPANAYGQMLTFGGYDGFFPFRIAYVQNSRLYFQGGGYRTEESFNFNHGDCTEWRPIAFTSDNVASATKLQSTRTIWGKPFDGTDNINGTFSYDNGDGTLKIYGVESTYGMETVAIQTCFDLQDPMTSIYPSEHGYRCVLSLQPRGGMVGINTTVPTYPLDVNGSARTKAFLCDGNLQTNTLEVNNNAFFYNRIYLDNGYFVWDYDNDAIYCDSNFYSAKGVTALMNSSTSDMRLKEVLRDIELDIREIADAPSFIHRWKDPGSLADGEFAGTSAQYWQKILPQVVSGQKWLSLDYGKAALLCAIALARKVKSLEIENMALKEKLTSIH